MEKRFIMVLLVCLTFLPSCDLLDALFGEGGGKGDKYVIRRENYGFVCQVWVSDAATVGPRIGGEYDSRSAAEAAMCSYLADGTCMGVNPEGACR